MDPDRRRFLRRLGIAMAALAAGGCCGTAAMSGTTEGGGGGGTEPTPAPPATGWDTVRAAWGDLPTLEKAAQGEDGGEKALAALTDRHQAALDEVVKAGELRKPVAGDIQAAFAEAAWHVWRSNTLMSCYEPPMPWQVHEQSAKHQLATQAASLAKMASTSDIDEATVAQAREAIERDIAFLTLAGDELATLQQAEAQTWRDFAELELEVDADAKEAAQILTEVLLGQR